MTMPTFTDGVVVHQTSLNALSTGVNNLNTVVTGAVAPRAYVPLLRLKRTAAQSIPNTTNTAVSWDTIDVNNDNMFTLVSPTQITIQTAGSYALDVEFGWAANNTGGRTIWGTKNSTSTANAVCIDEQISATMATGRGNTMHIATVLPNCVVGDTFFAIVYQASGGALNSVTTTAIPVSSLSMWRIGP
jgi:hypothetical protein